MDRREKVLHTLLGKPSNSIRHLYGTDKKIVSLLMAQGVFEKTGKLVMKESMSLVDTLNLIDCQLSMAPGIRNKKYVYYDGNIFVDCFAPKWPGRVFDRAAETFIRNLRKDPADWTPFIPSLVFSITKKCVYRCEHCYAVHSLGNKDIISIDELLRIAKDFQKIGIGVMSWEGGEPLLRFDDLITLIRETRDESESLIATTAFGLDRDKAQRLKEAGLTTAIISLDHYEPDKHNKFRRNKKAFDMAVNGVRIFRENGILPSICICATRDMMEEDGLYQYLELAKEIDAAFIQILDATPSGNYIGQDVMLTNSQLEEIKKFHIKVNNDPRYRDYPGIQARALLEDEEHFGCCGGNALCYVDSSGNMQACDLLQVSFGNVLEESVEDVFRRMKEYFPHSLKGRCPAQTLHKDFKKEFDKIQTLPIPFENSGKILEKIKKRKLPGYLQTIRDKQRRKKLTDFLNL